MANKILSKVFERKISRFIEDYKLSRELFNKDPTKILHTGEFGRLREDITAEFLKNFIPQTLSIDTGFIISSTNSVSTQCDLIISNKFEQPLLQYWKLNQLYKIRQNLNKLC